MPARRAESDKHGTFAFEGREYPVAVLNLPCVTESYKTYDDINYVKTTDVGQASLRNPYHVPCLLRPRRRQQRAASTLQKCRQSPQCELLSRFV